MTRLYKKEERRQQSPRKHRAPGKKTGPKKSTIKDGFITRVNGLAAQPDLRCYIPAYIK